MNLVRSISIAALAAAAANLAPNPALGQTPSTFTVVASKLAAPRGLRLGPDGDLYVAEAGTGGTNGAGRWREGVGRNGGRLWRSDRAHEAYG